MSDFGSFIFKPLHDLFQYILSCFLQKLLEYISNPLCH